MILIDANIFMYAAGTEHPNKAACAEFLRAVASGDIDAATDAEVLQEILHRYRALNRWSDGRRVYDLVRKLVGSILPVTAGITDRARLILDDHAELMARDALHAAVVLEHGLDAIMSFDRGFDEVTGVTRREP